MECGKPTTRDVLPYEAFEEALKDLDLATRTARFASEEASSLEDKLRFERLRSTIANARGSLRLMLFEYQDAAHLLLEKRGA